MEFSCNGKTTGDEQGPIWTLNCSTELLGQSWNIATTHNQAKTVNTRMNISYTLPQLIPTILVYPCITVTAQFSEWVQVMVFGPGDLYQHTLLGSITSPGESANPGLLEVGAAHWFDTQTIAPYGSRGPTPDGRIKPDIVGGACGETTLRPLEFSDRYGGLCGFAGTSQAAPHVAGLAALVKQANPSFTPQQLADFLKHNAADRDVSGPDNNWGYGFAQLRTPPAAPGPEPDPGTDACGETITADGAVTGTWAAGCQSTVSGRGYAQYYSFTLAQQSTVTIELEFLRGRHLPVPQGLGRLGAGSSLTRTTTRPTPPGPR